MPFAHMTSVLLGHVPKPAKHEGKGRKIEFYSGEPLPEKESRYKKRESIHILNHLLSLTLGCILAGLGRKEIVHHLKIDGSTVGRYRTLLIKRGEIPDVPNMHLSPAYAAKARAFRKKKGKSNDIPY